MTLFLFLSSSSPLIFNHSQTLQVHATLVDREAHAQEGERSHALFRVHFRSTSYCYSQMFLLRQLGLRTMAIHVIFFWLLNENCDNAANDINFTVQWMGEQTRSTGCHVIKRFEIYVHRHARFRFDSLYTHRETMRLRDFCDTGKTKNGTIQLRNASDRVLIVALDSHCSSRGYLSSSCISICWFCLGPPTKGPHGAHWSPLLQLVPKLQNVSHIFNGWNGSNGLNCRFYAHRVF